jgi:hypothetical protein
MLCGGLANAFANTTSIESDFSIMKWGKNDFWQSMMNLILKGIFQAKQFRVVMGIIVSTGFDNGVGTRGGAKILTQGGLTSDNGNIQCIIKLQWVAEFDYLLKDLDSLSWHPHEKIDNVIKIQSFDNDLFDTDDHKIDHPILTNKHCQY